VRLGQIAPCEPQDAENYGEDSEAPDLNGAAPDFVDGEDGEPVAGERAGANEDNLAGGGVAQVFVEVGALVEAHGREEGRGGEAEAIEGEVQKAGFRSQYGSCLRVTR
jgi:hypothetical protein